MTARSAQSPKAGGLWFSAFGGRYTGPETGWFDPAAYAWVPVLEENWTVMRDELLALTAKDTERLDAYFNHAIVFPPKSWKTLGLYFWSWPIRDNIRACPKTVGILSRIPNLIGASLSVLEPKSNINAHQGDTNAIIRVHLPLIVPSGLPDCGFQVGNEPRPWQEGKAMLFLDAKSHFAWNQTDRRRYVIILDVLRDEFAAQRAYICSNVLAAMFMQALCQRFPVLNRLPGRITQVLHRLAQIAIRLFLSFQKRVGQKG